MKQLPALGLIVAIASCGKDAPPAPSGPTPSFFVSSVTSATGNLGGLAGADALCQRLAAGIGQGARTWRAYLSAERDPANGGQPLHARDRIGNGPWYNVNLVLVANNSMELHSRTGDASVILDERGQRINGQWTGSPERRTCGNRSRPSDSAIVIACSRNRSASTGRSVRCPGFNS